MRSAGRLKLEAAPVGSALWRISGVPPLPFILAAGLEPQTPGELRMSSPSRSHTDTPMVAALYVERGGVYWDLPGVDPWDEERDARLYEGPWPVVAHPPCARWCQIAKLVELRYGYRQGDDGGSFAAALAAVETWG